MGSYFVSDTYPFDGIKHDIVRCTFYANAYYVSQKQFNCNEALNI